MDDRFYMDDPIIPAELTRRYELRQPKPQANRNLQKSFQILQEAEDQLMEFVDRAVLRPEQRLKQSAASRKQRRAMGSGLRGQQSMRASTHGQEMKVKQLPKPGGVKIVKPKQVRNPIPKIMGGRVSADIQWHDEDIPIPEQMMDIMSQFGYAVGNSNIDQTVVNMGGETTWSQPAIDEDRAAAPVLQKSESPISGPTDQYIMQNFDKLAATGKVLSEDELAG